MERKQIYDFVNTATKESMGQEGLVEEDLGNIVDTGTAIFNANAVDNYVRSLVNQVGKMVFVDRVYQGRVPSVLMDGWQYGSVMEKIRVELPEAIETEAWQLQDGQSYDPNIFYKPKAHVKFYNSGTTFTIPISITEKQVKESFQSATQMNAFISMIYTAVNNSMTKKTEALIKRTINNFIAETVYDAYGDDSQSGSSGNTRAINVLKMYNTENSTSLTASTCLHSKDFIRYFIELLDLYIERLSEFTVLYNIGGTEKFTPKDRLHVVMLSNVKAAALAYLSSDTFHDQYVSLPEAETINFWQGTGTNFSLENASKVDVVTSENHNITVNGVLCVMFDTDALGVLRPDKRVTSGYNPVGEFYNYWHKADASYFNDFDENFVVFFVA